MYILIPASHLSQILTSANLATFSLADAAQSLLGRRLEVLPPAALAQLAGLVPPTSLLSLDGAVDTEEASVTAALPAATAAGLGAGQRSATGTGAADSAEKDAAVSALVPCRIKLLICASYSQTRGGFDYFDPTISMTKPYMHGSEGADETGCAR